MYCGLNSCCQHPGGEKLTKRMLGLSSVITGKKVLDFGCGKADSFKLIEALGAAAYGLDKDESLCVNDNIKCINGNSFPFEDSFFDNIIAECSISCTNDPESILNEFKRVLKRGGICAISDLVAGVSGGSVRSFDEYTELFMRAGFEVIHTEDATKEMNELFIHLIFEGGREAAEKALGISNDERKGLKLSYKVWLITPNIREDIKEKSKGHPYISAKDISERPNEFIRLSPKDIERIITIPSSGSTGPAKRIYFTDHDLALTTKAFTYNVSEMANEGETCCIFMNGSHKRTVGGMLEEGLNRIGAKAVKPGFILSYEAAYEAAKDSEVILGLPGQIAALAAHYPDLRPRTVLLAGDYVSESIKNRIKELWHCEVFIHWGMSELAYGGAVDCRMHCGMHIKPDIRLWIEDPVTHEELPDGVEGEVVLSYIDVQAMPLINYRTGDRGVIRREVCKCGCTVPRLMGVYGRIASEIKMTDKSSTSINELDELLFSFSTIFDYNVKYNKKGNILFFEMETDIDTRDIVQRILCEKYPDVEIVINLSVIPASPKKRMIGVFENEKG